MPTYFDYLAEELRCKLILIECTQFEGKCTWRLLITCHLKEFDTNNNDDGEFNLKMEENISRRKDKHNLTSLK
jgi:hypothetical protein